MNGLATFKPSAPSTVKGPVVSCKTVLLSVLSLRGSAEVYVQRATYGVNILGNFRLGPSMTPLHSSSSFCFTFMSLSHGRPLSCPGSVGEITGVVSHSSLVSSLYICIYILVSHPSHLTLVSTVASLNSLSWVFLLHRLVWYGNLIVMADLATFKPSAPSTVKVACSELQERSAVGAVSSWPCRGTRRVSDFMG
jgi:hypothetical protein